QVGLCDRLRLELDGGLPATPASRSASAAASGRSGRRTRAATWTGPSRPHIPRGAEEASSPTPITTASRRLCRATSSSSARRKAWPWLPNLRRSTRSERPRRPIATSCRLERKLRRVALEDDLQLVPLALR